jgi:hypothetical protein
VVAAAALDLALTPAVLGFVTRLICALLGKDTAPIPDSSSDEEIYLSTLRWHIILFLFLGVTGFRLEFAWCSNADVSFKGRSEKQQCSCMF